MKASFSSERLGQPVFSPARIRTSVPLSEWLEPPPHVNAGSSKQISRLDCSSSSCVFLEGNADVNAKQVQEILKLVLLRGSNASGRASEDAVSALVHLTGRLKSLYDNKTFPGVF